MADPVVKPVFTNYPRNIDINFVSQGDRLALGGSATVALPQLPQVALFAGAGAIIDNKEGTQDSNVGPYISNAAQRPIDAQKAVDTWTENSGKMSVDHGRSGALLQAAFRLRPVDGFGTLGGRDIKVVPFLQLGGSWSSQRDTIKTTTTTTSVDKRAQATWDPNWGSFERNQATVQTVAERKTDEKDTQSKLSSGFSVDALVGIELKSQDDGSVRNRWGEVTRPAGNTIPMPHVAVAAGASVPLSGAPVVPMIQANLGVNF